MSSLGRIHTSDRVHRTVTIIVDGVPLVARAGETVAGALLAAGRRAWRHTPQGHTRGIFCGIGVCFDCLVTVNGVPNLRACLTLVEEGMVIQTR